MEYIVFQGLLGYDLSIETKQKISLRQQVYTAIPQGYLSNLRDALLQIFQIYDSSFLNNCAINTEPLFINGIVVNLILEDCNVEIYDRKNIDNDLTMINCTVGTMIVLKQGFYNKFIYKRPKCDSIAFYSSFIPPLKDVYKYMYYRKS